MTSSPSLVRSNWSSGFNRQSSANSSSETFVANGLKSTTRPFSNALVVLTYFPLMPLIELDVQEYGPAKSNQQNNTHKSIRRKKRRIESA